MQIIYFRQFIPPIIDFFTYASFAAPSAVVDNRFASSSSVFGFLASGSSGAESRDRFLVASPPPNGIVPKGAPNGDDPNLAGWPNDANGFVIAAAAGDAPDGAVSVMLADLPNTNLPGVAPPCPGGVKLRKLPPPAIVVAGLVSDEPPPKIDGVVEVATPPKVGLVEAEVVTPPKVGVTEVEAETPAKVELAVDKPPNVGFAEAELPKKEGFGQSGSDCKGVVFGTPNANCGVVVALVPNAIGFETDCFSSRTGERVDFGVEVVASVSVSPDSLAALA